MSTVRVLLIAAALGSVVGTAFAFHREAQDAAARRAVEEAPDQLPQAQFPDPASAVAQAGPVTLAAVDGLPQYPGAFVRPITAGEQLNVAWFSTKDSVEQVLAFYEKQFIEEGKLVVSYQFSEASGYAGYLDLEDHRMHLVSVLRQGDQTLAFPSTSYPEKMLEGGAQPPAGVPNIAGAEGTLAFDLGSGPQKKQVWLATYAGRSVDEVTDAWRAGLVEKGWTVTRAEETGQVRLDAAGSAGGLQVAIRRDASARVAVYVTAAGPRGAP